jgi:hypothetical protein
MDRISQLRSHVNTLSLLGLCEAQEAIFPSGEAVPCASHFSMLLHMFASLTLAVRMSLTVQDRFNQQNY